MFGELEGPDPADARGWRATITDFAIGLRATVLRHPWLASVFGEVGTLYLGPNMMRGNEAILAVFEEAGFGMEEADQSGSRRCGPPPRRSPATIPGCTNAMSHNQQETYRSHETNPSSTNWV